MKNKIRYCITSGLGAVQFVRERNQHMWAGSKFTFARYVKLLKAHGWTEVHCGSGINLREPPKEKTNA